ncbi:MAG: hypothetical protein M3Q83_00335 [Pseudomonadota bacterium]|nr:hypothetical protein [Pseudomonadota bacterium]
MTNAAVSITRSLLIVVLALLGAWLVVRSALVTLYAAQQPALAARVWPSHPKPNIALAMSDIGAAAAAGRSVSEPSLRRIERAASKAPLIADPFTIKGALLQSLGRAAQAERLFAESKRRDPRSAAPRYFLAERYLTTGRTSKGLQEVSALARLVPGGGPLIVAGIVQIARAAGPSPELLAMLRANPTLTEAVLATLASDAANADLVMRLAAATPKAAAGADTPAWQIQLLSSLTERGEYRRARGLWNRVAGAAPESAAGLFNREFAELAAPPPFNWKLGAGSFGVVETAPGGKLQVIYYGREDAELASQLLLLEPGRYRLSLTAAGDGAANSAVAWSLTCATANTAIASLPLSGATIGGQALSTDFSVPASNCDAQWLRLIGSAAEFADSEQVTIGNLNIVPVDR